MKIYRLVHRLALLRNPHPFVPTPSQARWNSAGVRMAYTSEHPALVAMEILTYWHNYPTLSGYRLFSMTLEGQSLERVPDALDIHDYAQTRPFGDAWVQQARSLALAVPSVVVPLSTNYLINPAHPEFAGLTFEDHGEFEYDGRVQQLLGAAAERPG